MWLVTHKKQVRDKYVSTSEVLDELLCFGWVDGIRRKLNKKQTMQLISRRKVEHWAEIYKQRALKLLKEGKMHEHGLRAIERSKQAGLWNFMDDVDQLIITDDLMKALSIDESAKEFFININPSSRRFVLRWLKLAKTGKTRKSRIEQLFKLSQKCEKLNGS